MDPSVSKLMNNSYFTYINMSTETIKKGQQAYISYGSGTNQFFLKHYGFSFPNNVDDSYKFNLNLQVSTVKKLAIKDMIAFPNQFNNVQKIKLKRNQLSFTLISYIRHIKKHFFFKSFLARPENLLTKVTSLGYELYCFNTYLDLVKHFSE
jgi:hypothetical protein